MASRGDTSGFSSGSIRALNTRRLPDESFPSPGFTKVAAKATLDAAQCL
jgi:hypothetical protein